MNPALSIRLNLVLGCGLFLVSVPGLALDPTKSVFQFNCKNWTSEDGLPANGINAITQTKDGFLWLGTQRGLVRFDGVEFTTFTTTNKSQFRNQVISALSSASHGGLWFGLREGAFGFHSQTTGFVPTQEESWINPTMNILSMREVSDGSVWVGANNGTARWIPGQTNATRYFAGRPGWTIYEDAHGRVWLGTVESGLHYWQGGTLNAFPDPSLAKESVTALVEDGLGQIWVGTQSGLRCYDAQFQRKEVPPLYAEVKALMVDRSGVLWVGTTGLGLATLRNGAFTHFQKTDGLASENVTALLEDREGTLWIGTRNGLSQLTDVKFSTLSNKDGILARGSHSVRAASQGGVWAAMALGVSHIDGNTVKNYTQDAGLASGYVKLVYPARDGDVYLVNGDKSIEVLAGGQVVARYENTNWPTSLAEDVQGVIVSIGDGLFRVGRTRIEPYEHSTREAPPLYWVRNMITCRDGSLLIASVNGLFRLTRDGFDRWSTQNGLSDNDVLWVMEDSEGDLWAGLTTGMARIRGKQVRNFNISHGLYDNFIYAIVPDDYGSFWINSTRGIFRVSRKELNDFADERIPRINCSGFDNLEAAKVMDTTEVEYSGCKTSDGRIWFPSPHGIIMLDPTNLCYNHTPPPVHIQHIRVNGLELTGRTGAAVRPGRGDLEFKYTAASFVSPKKVRFRYRLEGYERDWVEADGRRSAFYTNLKPGKYRFQVQACNADGIWNTTGDSFSIELPPRFHQTAWFHILCGLAAAAVLAALYAWRVGHLRRKQKKLETANELLESKVRERTRELLDVSRQAGMAEVATSVLHNVGNVLNSVNVSATIVEERINHSGADNLAKVVNLIREHREDLPDFFAHNPKGKQLVSYLEALVRHLGVEKAEVLGEMQSLAQNVGHIKEIVAMQQTYARVGGVTEIINVSELVEDALRVQAISLERQQVSVLREFSPVPPINVDRHKVIQILVNLLQNAVQACDAAKLPDRKIIVRIVPDRSGRIQIEVADNGIGILPENLTLIFSHGFTTRKDGHGFGLHSAALAAKELGGILEANSDGPGQGAVFTLLLPEASTSPADTFKTDNSPVSVTI